MAPQDVLLRRHSSREDPQPLLIRPLHRRRQPPLHPQHLPRAPLRRLRRPRHLCLLRPLDRPPPRPPRLRLLRCAGMTL